MKKIILKEYLLSTIGALLTAFGLAVFLMPHDIACGGANGLAIVLNSVVHIPVGILMYGINIVLFIFSFVFIGKEFGAKSIYCTFILNFFVDLFDRILPIPKYTGDDMFLAVFFGVIISAVGMALTFSQNASTGGTDIIAKIFNKYFGISLGIGLLISDLIIGLLAGIAYNPTIGMYSIVSVIINGLTVDFIIRGMTTDITMMIISEKKKEILEYILKDLDRGASLINAEGAYSGQKKQFIYVALSRREKNETIYKIQSIDPNAFITVQPISTVIGYGFKSFKQVV